jgi:hypothetical protein
MPAALTVMLRACVTVCTGVPESVAFTVKLVVPVALGVPVMAPVLEFRLAQEGNAPEEMLQVTGGVPPVNISCWLYAELTVPLGKLVVVMTSVAAVTVMLNACVAVCGVGEVESVALTVKLVVAAALGVPVMAPVLGSSEAQEGSEPEEMLQVIGAAPPLDMSVGL